MIDNEEYFNEDLVDNLLDEDEITTDTGELYEHFRMVVDSGQGSVRIDKFLFERCLILAVIVFRKLLKLVAFMLWNASKK